MWKWFHQDEDVGGGSEVNAQVAKKKVAQTANKKAIARTAS